VLTAGQEKKRQIHARQRSSALVNQKSHLNGLDREGNERSILKGLGGKEKTGIDVVLFQAGILLQDLLHGAAMGQESQYVPEQRGTYSPLRFICLLMDHF